MSTYKEIRGLKVRDYTTNPDNPIEGQLWYNETDNVAKYQIPNLSVGSWSTGNTLNNGRTELQGAGIQTSALMFGGNPPASTAETEQWNGTSWTEVADLNSGRSTLGGAGTSTSALAFGGEGPAQKLAIS